ncbi:aldo/keto reductase [Microbispora sp. CA-102843]|uniref:aldo/keto reductase n=1 Tax=Microbispora sp. CA-102843 TaxID=3239952 RepID=UPI003D9244B5
MHPTTLGADGPAVSRLGLGCMSMTGSYGPADPHEAAATLLEALDAGVTMFDTGDFYDDGANEITAVQSEYSLWERHVEGDILPTVRSLGAALVAYSPLGRGLLTGAVRATTRYESGDFRATAPRYNGDNLTANLTIVDAITALAAAKNATPAQIALAWLLTRGSDVIPIPGSSRRPHLRDNLAALDVHLTATDLGHIDAAVPAAGAQGARYGDHGIRMIDQ